MSDDTYNAFIKSKVKLAETWGFDVPDSEVNPRLKDHQRAIVRWIVAGGRRGCFAAFGLGKSVIQLEACRLLLSRAGGRALIIAPLGVRQEFMKDAVTVLGWATPPTFIRTIEEAAATGIYLTNYETVRDGKLDPAEFTVVSLDEASILRGLGGTKTFRELMRQCTGDGGPSGVHRQDGKRVAYRIVATATPSPNEYIELLAYAEFLGIMDVSQAKTRFFKRDSTKADNLTLHPHKENEFWMWVASWAIFIQKPSDICPCPCHKESNSKAGGSECLLSSDGSSDTPGEGGPVDATAVERDVRRRPTSSRGESSAADASESSMAARAPELTRSGEGCTTGADDPGIKTGTTTAAEASPSVKDGQDSQLSSPIWESRPPAPQSSESTTPAGTNPATADGKAVRPKLGTPDAPSSSPSGGEPSRSPRGRMSCKSTIGSSIRATSSAGPRNASSPTCCSVCRCDEGYSLPPITVNWHEVPTDHSEAGADRSGQTRMFRDAAIGVQDAAAEKRISLPNRIAKLLELRAEDLSAHRIIWHDLEAEREAIEDALPIRTFGHWQEFKDGHPDGLALYDRHYSAHQYTDGRARKLFCGPGKKTVLLTAKRDALFVWREFIDDSGQEGVNCAVFRNEGPLLSSELIREAMGIAWQRWPGRRLYTFVNAEEVESSNPGCCFKMAGWTECGKTKGGLLIFEALPSPDAPTVEGIEGCRSIYGSQDLDVREQAIADFSDGKFAELAAKPVIAGSGCNFQRHCAWAIYLGIGFKFNDFIQSIHRIQRFLQTRPVRIDIIYTEAEREVRRQLERKWSQHKVMVAKMTAIIREHGLSQASMAHTLTRKLGIERVEVTGPGYRLVNNDCVLEARATAEASVGLVLTSIPFSSQYEYSPNYSDFGHSEGNAEFFQQMDFLTPELLRVLKPGRVAAVHVKDRIVPSGMNKMGFQTVYPFHSECIRHYTRHGFGYMGMITIVTDVVRENNQTYRLGWTEQCKDGTKMGVGMPEYLLLFRKPPTDRAKSYADEPVTKSKPLVAGEDGTPRPFGGSSEKQPIIPGSGYSRAKWQTDAHGFWRSSGNRLLTPEELRDLPHDQIFQLFKQHSLTNVYDFEHHVRLGESMESEFRLPVTFMLLQPQSWSDDVWSDVTRMLTLNTAQHQKGAQMHLCPMQFDLADRVIERFSAPGDVVLDPFGGLMTVPFRAIKQRRQGLAFELNAAYFADGAAYCRIAAEEMSMPTLFDLDAFSGKPAEPKEAA